MMPKFLVEELKQRNLDSTYNHSAAAHGTTTILPTTMAIEFEHVLAEDFDEVTVLFCLVGSTCRYVTTFSMR